MFDVFGYLQQVMFLVRDTRENRQAIEELKERLERLSAKVAELAFDLERYGEHEHHEREKLTLQLENTLLRFENRLPAKSN